MDIRPYQEADIPAIARLYFNTVRRINARDYTREQIQAWAPTIYSNSYWSQRFLKKQVLVAESRNGVLGFAEYEAAGHIDCFYVHHEYQRRGVGSALLDRVEDALRSLNVHRAFAEVSVTARAFFAGKGYRVVEERNQDYRDVIFKLYLMEKYLTGGRGKRLFDGPPV